MAIARGNPSEVSEASSHQKPFKMPAYVVDVATRILDFYPNYKDKDWQKAPQLAVQYINSALNFVIRPIRTIVSGSTPEQDTQLLPDIPTLRKQACQLLITDISIAEDKSIDEWINLAIKLGEEAYSAAIYQNGANFCNFLHGIRSLIITTLLSDPEATQKLKTRIAELKREYETHAKEISIEAGKGHATSRLEEKKKQAILARAYLQDDEARLTVSRDKTYMGNLPCPERGEKQPNGLDANPNYNTCLQNEYYLTFFEQYLLPATSPIKSAKPSSKYRKVYEEFEKYKLKKGKYSHNKLDDSSSDEDELVNSDLALPRRDSHPSQEAGVPTLEQFIFEMSSSLGADTNAPEVQSTEETTTSRLNKSDEKNELENRVAVATSSSSSSTGQIAAGLRNSGSVAVSSQAISSSDSIGDVVSVVPVPPAAPKKAPIPLASQGKYNGKKKTKNSSAIQGENTTAAETNPNPKPSL
jgi:hypothetical protein